MSHHVICKFKTRKSKQPGFSTLKDVFGELQHQFPWQRVRCEEGLPNGRVQPRFTNWRGRELALQALQPDGFSLTSRYFKSFAVDLPICICSQVKSQPFMKLHAILQCRGATARHPPALHRHERPFGPGFFDKTPTRLADQTKSVW